MLNDLLEFTDHIRGLDTTCPDTLPGFLNDCKGSETLNWNQQKLFFTRAQISYVIPRMCPNLNPIPESPGHNWLIHSSVYSRTANCLQFWKSIQVTYRYWVNMWVYRWPRVHVFPPREQTFVPTQPTQHNDDTYCEITVFLYKHKRTRVQGRLSSTKGWGGQDHRKRQWR